VLSLSDLPFTTCNALKIHLSLAGSPLPFFLPNARPEPRIPLQSKSAPLVSWSAKTEATIDAFSHHRILAPLSPTQVTTDSHRRRRSSLKTSTPCINIQEAPSPRSYGLPGASSGLPADGFAQPLPPIPGTPSAEMSLSRSPSPNRGGGWSSPGLTTPYDTVSGRSSPRRAYGGEYQSNVNGGPKGSNVTWASAKVKSEGVNGYPSFSTRNNGFFSRHARKLSRSLPSFNIRGQRYAEKEKLGRGRHNDGKVRQLATHFGRLLWRMRLRLLVVMIFILSIVLFYVTREYIPMRLPYRY